MIKGTTRLLGVVGYPIDYALSPVMHNAAIAHVKADYVFVAFPVKPEDLACALKGFESIGVRGFSVTIPHKQNIIPLLKEITPEARMIGAVNAVWRTEGGWKGTNYDCFGFTQPLEAMHCDWKDIAPIVLGNGGAARAVVVGCHSLGCPEIHVFGRNQDRLTWFAQSWRDTPIEHVLKVHSWDELGEIISRTRLLVNATPMGMHPDVGQSPLSEEMIRSIQPGTIVYDLVYTPRPTLFLEKAERSGAVVIDGLEMLVQQGAKALETWLDQPAPVDIMREAMRRATVGITV